jgi:hypothetical protein
MRQMVEFMMKICGKPRHQVVAMLMGIAFPPTVDGSGSGRRCDPPRDRDESEKPVHSAPKK